MGLLRTVYVSDVEDSALENELLLRRVDNKRIGACDSVPKLIRACVRYVILNQKLGDVNLEGTQ